MVSPLIEASYRNRLEAKAGEQLADAGVEFTYETLKLPVEYPPRTGKYTPDFLLTGTPIIIETKGQFTVQDRQKMMLVKAQHPGLDFRIVFQRAANKLYKNSPTTYSKWCDDHGFAWADKGIIPQAWLKEITAQQKRSSGHSSIRKAKKSAGRGREA